MPYLPDLEKIAAASANPEPLILTEEEYEDLLQRHRLHRGQLSDVGILKAMELGLIKVWTEDGNYNPVDFIESNNLDVTLGNEFWFYRPHEISRLTLGKHLEAIKALDLLVYNYKADGDVFTFHPNTLVLALTREVVSLSNVVTADFDGKSVPARLGLSSHQTAGQIHSGFCGQITLELSNALSLDVAVPVGKSVSSLKFNLIAEPSSRPRSSAQGKSWNHLQSSPFGYRLPEWEEIKRNVVKSGISDHRNGFDTTGDYSHK